MRFSTLNETALLSKLRKGISDFNKVLLFYMDPNDKILACCYHHEFEDVHGIYLLSFFKEFDDLTSFLVCFPIDSPQELFKVKRSHFLDLFENGLIDFSCYVEKQGKGRRFFFRKKNNQLVIFEENKSEQFKVNQIFKSGSDFVRYAMDFAENYD